MLAAIIPARGGSVRLPGKNMLRINGVTLIGHAISCANDSRLFDNIILSTDNEDYAAEGRRYGAAVPYLRPAPLATAGATSADVAIHVLDAAGIQDATLVLLQPTSPCRTPDDIRGAVELYREGGAPAVVSVKPNGEPNGAVYVIDFSTLRTERTFYPKGTVFFEMPDSRSIDIDTAEDFDKACRAMALNWDG
jgi:CMP-N-acetylneuraminic acid synthetase